MPASRQPCVSDADAAKWKYVNTACPRRSSAISCACGSFTFTIRSASPYTAGASSTSVAPAAW